MPKGRSVAIRAANAKSGATGRRVGTVTIAGHAVTVAIAGTGVRARSAAKVANAASAPSRWTPGSDPGRTLSAGQQPPVPFGPAAFSCLLGIGAEFHAWASERATRDLGRNWAEHQTRPDVHPGIELERPAVRRQTWRTRWLTKPSTSFQASRTCPSPSVR